ncbi:NAD(FAD)-dependent dehydrogenase [Liquorilactobacillus aquaticus DSM 21051]|uniref:NAD(FAD)-dependent dehydrogenase n=1 Tax=Liquorilactobacillus aquaticus DSM 21051 TaxID=1423725 RepID=A0A0R2CTU0_9LACO|nr:FAD-dependent oxidoreductase [Liquorilactobacillus aquaticus]KRM95183.1 NAD(FAD)-dependent dehydrogenase [Liquorilactobacillus aquaticus DSM 21051]
MKVAVVGCTHAGTFAVKQILSDYKDVEVTVFERNEEISFLSCGIALYLGGQVKDPQGLFYSNPEELKKLGASIKTRHNVREIDPRNHTLEVENLATNELMIEHYDKLVMTTGSWPIVPNITGIKSEKVLLCKNWSHAQELFKRVPKVKRIAVIGAGYIGAELVEAYSLKGHEVSLIDAQTRVMPKYFDPAFTNRIEADFEANGVQLELGQSVQSFEEKNGELIIKTDKKAIAADLAILCIGFRPNTALLADKVEMTPNGAIITDDYMRSSDPDILAAGDSAAVHYNPTGKNAYIPLATNAVRQGILVGKNLKKPTMRYIGTQSTSGLSLYGTSICATGLTAESAKNQRIDAKQVIFEDNYRPEFMPSTTPILMSLVYDAGTRRILGGALMSKYDISQSANLLSLCIQNKNTIDDLAMVDMLFQPTFDRPFNYLNLLGQAAQAQAAKVETTKTLA